MDIIAANISRMTVNVMKCSNDTAGEKYEFTYNTPWKHFITNESPA